MIFSHFHPPSISTPFSLSDSTSRFQTVYVHTHCDNSLSPLPGLHVLTFPTTTVLVVVVLHRPYNIPQLYGKHGAFPQRNHNTNTAAHDHIRDITRTTRNSSNKPSLETSHLLPSYKQHTSKVTSFDLSLSSVFFSETYSQL